MTRICNQIGAKKFPTAREFSGDTALATYLNDISDSTPLSSIHEVALARRIRTGDGTARNELVEANLRFVVSVAKDYQNRGLSLTEIISAGNVGLITAAERFDETKGFKFITYAVWWIRQAILQTLMEQSAVRIPVNRLEMFTKISRAYEALAQQGKPISTQAVASLLGCSDEEVELTLAAGQPIRSLDAAFDDAEERCLYDCLSDEGQLSAEEEMFGFSLQQDVETALKDLNRREAEVLRLYFGVGCDHPLTLGQIGVKFGLTRERIRQIKELALSKLRHPRFHGRLRVYTEN